jgi:kinesin family protein 15
MQAKTPLRVAVRIRPRLARDKAASGGAITAVGDNAIIVDGAPDSFSFSRCFGGNASQVAVFEHCGAPQVAAVIDGLDACVFAFGQT